MANINDVLKKNKSKIANIKTERKKIKRKGPVRPWQESLKEYQDVKDPANTTEVVLKADSLLKVPEHSSRAEPPNLPPNIANSEICDPGALKSITNQNRTHCESEPNNKKNQNRIKTEFIANPNGIMDSANYPTLNNTSPTSYRTNYELTANQNVPNSNQNRTNNEPKPNSGIAASGEAPVTRNHYELNSHQNRTHSESDSNLPSSHSELNEPLNRMDYASKTVSIQNQKRTHSESNSIVQFGTSDFSKLSNLKQKILITIYEDCRSLGDRTTRPFRLSALSTNVGCKYDSCRNAVRQLANLKIINKDVVKRGQGGFVQLSMSEAAFTTISAHLQTGLYRGVSEFLVNQNRINSASETESVSESNHSSKLVSNNYLTNFTNRKEEMISFYENVNFSVLDTNETLFNNKLTREKVIGEIAKNQWNIKPHELEEMISKFSNYIVKPEASSIRSVQSFFFNQLKNIHLGDFSDIEGESSENENILLEMKRKALAKKAQIGALKEETTETYFDLWWESSTEDDFHEIAPQVFQFKNNQVAFKNGIRGAWLEKVWPKTFEYKQMFKEVKALTAVPLEMDENTDDVQETKKNEP